MGKLYLLIISILCCNILTFGQDTLVQKDSLRQIERPMIGLVLSGGGAKGLAHCGILEAIDSARLHIDYITGTSMGAIVGAMYASGYTGRQIEEIAGTMDWMQAMRGADRYREVSIERKDDYASFTVELPIEHGRIKPFTGILEPQGVMLKFHEVFYPIYKIRNFENLNIPFRCVATDIGSGEAVVIKEGSMPFAVRSSMAIPGVFSAMDYKNTKLVDGGIVRNFPVRDVREMGADFVIGVNLFSGLTESKDMTTMLDVMMQTMNFRDAADLENEKSICDVVIEPDVAQYTAASFGAADSIFVKGKEKGAEFYPIFKQLADYMHNVYGVPYAEPNNRMAPYTPDIQLTELDVYGLKHTTKKLLLQNLDIDLGKTYNIDEINYAFSRAFSSGYYSNLNYDILPMSHDADDNRVRLQCVVDERPLSLLKVGFSYNTFSSAALMLGYERKNLTSKHSTTSLKLAVSGSLRFRAQNRNYFGEKRNFYLDEIFQTSHYYVPLYEDKHKAFEYAYTHIHTGASAGLLTSQTSDIQLMVGYDSFRLKTDMNAGMPTAITGTINNFFAELKFRRDLRDRPNLPQTGVHIVNDFYFAASPNYYVDFANQTGPVIEHTKPVVRYTFMNEVFQQPHNKVILGQMVGLAATYGSQTFVHQNYLGGPYSIMPSHFVFYGLTAAQKNIPSLAMARFSATYKFYSELYLTAHINGALTYDNVEYYIEDRHQFKPDDFIVGGGLTAGYNLSVLPIEFTMAYSPDYKFNLYVNIGFLF